VKRKRVVSILSRQAAWSIKEDENALKKAKTAPEPKATISKKQKLDRIPSTEPKVDKAAEKTPPSPSAAKVVKILKVMTKISAIQAAKSSGIGTDKTFTEEGNAFGYRGED
jgi:hypothetical protein